jgi:hypothetical protein
MASALAKEVIKKSTEKAEISEKGEKDKSPVNKTDQGKSVNESKKEEEKADKKEVEAKKEVVDATGVIINVKGHPYQPVMFPKILDDKNNEIFAIEKADPSLVNEGKLVSYYLSENAAKNSERVKDRPVIINAVDVKNKSEIIIKSEDARKINKELLKNGRLAIIVD